MNLFVLLLCCPFACFVFVNFTILLNFGFALSLCKRTFFECYYFILFFRFALFFSHNFHRLLQCCALVIRMCTICITRFLICVYSLPSQCLTITCFRITESRLDSRISDQNINIPNYCISGKDSIVIGQTGIAVYIHNSIADITHRCQDHESDRVECIWLELKPSTIAPSIFYFFFNT